VTALSVNLNKVALLRNARDTAIPDLATHARWSLEAGAAGITVHPRPDQRHIRADDCRHLAPLLAGLGVEFNIEGNPEAGPRHSDRVGVSDYPGFIALATELRPAQCTLVPDSDAQLTSDHGFDLTVQGDTVATHVAALRALNIRVSLFMDPDPVQIRLAADLGCDRVELYTEAYARAVGGPEEAEQLRRFRSAADAALDAGLGVNAGHDLNLRNLPVLRSAIPELLEVSIGHALTVDALRLGWKAAVRAYLDALGHSPG